VIQHYSTVHYQSHFATWMMKLYYVLVILGYQLIPHSKNHLIIHIFIKYPTFDYCLPHSYLNLSNPDSQCQFNKSGVLCGKCQHDLSAVFGSSQCKHCFNMYLFIIIPIEIAGIILVIILFIFNLTVLNETINTFIFYVNIIDINMFTL